MEQDNMPRFPCFASSAQTDASANRSAWQATPERLSNLLSRGCCFSMDCEHPFGFEHASLAAPCCSYSFRSIAWLCKHPLHSWLPVFWGECIFRRANFESVRFFADRGVHWSKLVISQLAYPALLLTLLVSYAATSATTAFEVASLFSSCFAVFAVGMFSSLVFPNPIISIMAALAVSSVAMYFTAFGVSIWSRIAPEYWLPISIWFRFLLASC